MRLFTSHTLMFCVFTSLQQRWNIASLLQQIFDCDTSSSAAWSIMFLQNLKFTSVSFGAICCNIDSLQGQRARCFKKFPHLAVEHSTCGWLSVLTSSDFTDGQAEHSCFLTCTYLTHALPLMVATCDHRFSFHLVIEFILGVFCSTLFWISDVQLPYILLNTTPTPYEFFGGSGEGVVLSLHLGAVF